MTEEKETIKGFWTGVGFTVLFLGAILHGSTDIEPFGWQDWLMGALLIISIYKSANG